MTQRTFLFALAGLLLMAGPPIAPAGEAATNTAVAGWRVFDGHFESNQSGLKGDTSVLAFTDAAAFQKIFGTVPPLMRSRPKAGVKPADFAKNIVVALIHRGSRVWEYQVESVTVARGVLRVRCTSTVTEQPTATFACPLILAVPKGDFASVVFVENGKEAGAAPVR